MFEFLPISKLKAEHLAQESHHTNIEEITDLIFSLKMNVLINLRDLEFLSKTTTDKNIDFCIKIFNDKEIKIQPIYKNLDIANYLYSNRTGDGDIICFRYDQKEYIIKNLILKDYFRPNATDEFGNVGVYFYKNEILIQDTPSNILKLREELEKSKNIIKKFNL